ncbi:UNVERIFIED_CONTAM: hypothetical protein FKN15_068294 [Acipenser sinensis]
MCRQPTAFFHTADSPCSHPRATVSEDNAALRQLAGKPAGARPDYRGRWCAVNGFRSYVDLYVKDKLDETGVALKVVNETVNDRWEVCLTMSEKGFQQVSFVNSIATTKRALLSVVWILPTVNQDHGGYPHGYPSPCTFKCSKIIMKTEGKRKRLSPQPDSPALCFTPAFPASVTLSFPQHGHPNA